VNPFIHECCEVSRKNRAEGGKLVGAGDREFFMLYFNSHDETKLIEAMLRMGLGWERVHSILRRSEFGELGIEPVFHLFVNWKSM